MTATLVEVADRHARERGDRLAFAMLASGNEVAARLTFGELDAQARAIAAGLLAAAQPGDRAVLVHEAGLDFVAAFMGCLYAGIVAVPIPAPEASRMKSSLARLDAVLHDSGARLLVGNARTREMLGATAALGPTGPRWLDSAALGRLTPSGAAAPSPLRESLAYLQYTSGSTSTPKGVMITHANVARHLENMRGGLGYDQASVSICWMPHFHDYGLVEGILLPLFNGTPAYLMSPFTFLKRPASWLEAVSAFRGTHTQAFNFAYRYCVRRVSAAQRGALDLRSLRSAGNGGEPIHPGPKSGRLRSPGSSKSLSGNCANTSARTANTCRRFNHSAPTPRSRGLTSKRLLRPGCCNASKTDWAIWSGPWRAADASRRPALRPDGKASATTNACTSCWTASGLNCTCWTCCAAAGVSLIPSGAFRRLDQKGISARRTSSAWTGSGPASR